MQVLIEAGVIGFLMVILYMVVMKVVDKVDHLKTVDKQFVTLGAIGATGALFHLIAEFSGVNAWYCNNAAALSRGQGDFSNTSYSF
jgi:hypothetical protein